MIIFALYRGDARHQSRRSKRRLTDDERNPVAADAIFRRIKMCPPEVICTVDYASPQTGYYEANERIDFLDE